MPYEVYYNKTEPKGLAESPSNGLSQSPITNQSISLKQAAGIALVGTTVINTTKQIGSAILTSTGNSRLQRTVDRVTQLGVFGLTAVAINLPVAATVEAVKFIGGAIVNGIEEDKRQTSNQYDRFKQGASVNKFTGVGGYYD